MASKLHKQFGHPVNSERLKQLLCDANIRDDDLFKQIDTVTESCDICERYKKARNRRSFIILYMTDVFTRFSQAVIISSNHKETIANAILKHWVSIFGVQSILSDNGGEFDNSLLDVAELLGTKVLTTAAYSPWSNGIVERHNAVIENMILKITRDTNCSVENALVWIISAKNAFHNNLCYSPNQLVFGRNPNLPSVLTARPPALHTTTTNQLIADHLNALHVARQAFIQSEALNKLKLLNNDKHLQLPVKCLLLETMYTINVMIAKSGVVLVSY